MSYRLHKGSLTSNRVESLQARVRLLERALDHPSLTRQERRVLHASIRWQRSRMLREVAEAASSEGSSGKAAVVVAQGRELLARVRFAPSRSRWPT
jgi:hypothetical protein